jgi:outer membrane protein TolC
VRTLIVFFAIFFCWSSSTFAADQPIRLSLGEAIRMAAEKNLDVRAELYNPAQFEAEINRNKAIYDPLLNIQINYNDTTSPVSDTTTTFSSRGHSFQLNTSISQLFWTGATASLGFNNNYSSANSFTILNDFWQSSLGVTLSQPLLKNAGRENTEINILISRFSKFASLEHFKNVLLNTITQVRIEYFKLYSLREQLEVRKVSLALARKILSETKARVAAGVLPAMEILNAEFGVTSREKDLIDAEKSVSDQVDVLRLLLQINSKDDIIIIDLPRKELYQPDQGEAIQHALSRPDIKELKRSLDISELQTRVFNNNLKPDLSFNITGSLVGQDRTYDRDLDRIGRIDYPAWSVGLVLNYPLGNHAAENDYRKSRLKNAQAALQIQSLEQSAINDVLNSIRAVTSAYKQIEVADRGRAFAEERLRAFMRRNAVGLATTKDVMDVENDLVTAKNNQITAAVAYDNAITRHMQVTGVLLEKEGVRVVEGDADKLYTNTR